MSQSSTSASTTSPQKQKSAFQRINDECGQMREQIINLKNQKGNLNQAIKKQETQLKIFQVKYNSLEAQLKKVRADNHKFIQELQKQKKEKVEIVTNYQNVLNSLSRDQIELSRITNQNKTLKEQNLKFQKQFQIQQVDRVNYLKDKQNTVNKITLLQTKLQAATMELKYTKIKIPELQNQNTRLREQVSQISKSLAEKQVPLKVQTIYKDQSSTKQKLLTEFQQKIKDKQQLMREEIQKYQKKVGQLTQKVAYLQAERNSKK